MYGFDIRLAVSCIVTIAIEISGTQLASLFYFYIFVNEYLCGEENVTATAPESLALSTL